MLLLAAGCVMRERGHLVEASSFLGEAEILAQSARQLSVMAVCAAERAFLDLAMQRFGVGRARLAEFVSTLEDEPSPMVANRLKVANVRMALAFGDTAAAQQILDFDSDRNRRRPARRGGWRSLCGCGI